MSFARRWWSTRSAPRAAVPPGHRRGSSPHGGARGDSGEFLTAADLSSRSEGRPGGTPAPASAAMRGGRVGTGDPRVQIWPDSILPAAGESATAERGRGARGGVGPTPDPGPESLGPARRHPPRAPRTGRPSRPGGGGGGGLGGGSNPQKPQSGRPPPSAAVDAGLAMVEGGGRAGVEGGKGCGGADEAPFWEPPPPRKGSDGGRRGPGRGGGVVRQRRRAPRVARWGRSEGDEGRLPPVVKV